MTDETELTIAAVTSFHESPRSLAAKAVSLPQVVTTVPQESWRLWKSLAWVGKAIAITPHLLCISEPIASWRVTVDNKARAQHSMT